MKQILCVLLLAVATNVCAQESGTRVDEKQDPANSLNLRLQTMQIALAEIRNLKSDLELVDSQRKALETLSRDYAKMVQSIMQLERENAGADAAIALCLQKMKGYEDRLSSEILLPHQSSELRKMVFGKLVRENNEDWLVTLSTYYPSEFKLTADQKRRMKKIDSSSAEKIAKAKEEFENKLKEIRNEARDEIRHVLTEKQSKLLTELAGTVKK